MLVDTNLPFLNQAFSDLDNSRRLVSGQFSTAPYEPTLATANRKIDEAQNRQMYASAGIVAVVALAVFLGFTFGLIAGLAMGICALIPCTVLKKAKNDELRCMEPVYRETAIISHIYDRVADYFTGLQQEREGTIKTQYGGTSTVKKQCENAEDLQLAQRIVALVNPVQLHIRQDYVLLEKQDKRWMGGHFTAWEHLQAVCKYNIQRCQEIVNTR